MTEAYIVTGVRTPIGRYAGALAAVRPDELAAHVLRELGLPDDAEHVNPNGGALALGHPLGASSARLALTAATELADRGAQRAVVTMSVGVGQGISVLMGGA